MFVAIAVLGTIVAVVIFFCFKQLKFKVSDYLTVLKLPGPSKKGFFIGNMEHLWETPETMFKVLRELGRKYYPIYTFYTLGLSSANILSPEDCELILSNPLHNAKGLLYHVLADWLKTGLLTSNGKKWQTRRKILTPAFHFNILQQFVTVFNEETEKLVEILKDECQKPYTNISPHITQFTLKTITETAMGTKLKFATKKEIDYKQAVIDIGDIILYRVQHPWFLFAYINMLSPYYFLERQLLNILHTFTRDVISERQKNFKEIELPTEEHDVYKSKRRLAMLDLLLTAKNNEGIIDEEGIREEVDTFMFEGHDTTSAAISFALMLMACNRRAQDQIVQEMHDVLGDIHKKPTYNDLQELKYMERCIKESLRLYPSVCLMSRKLGEELTTHSGYLLPKDTTLIIHIYDMHHNPDIYPDPKKFDPDRFLPENSQKRHPYAYLPFSAGLRNCIGQRFAMLELKAALCGILANFILEPVDTPDTIVLVVDIILRTKEGIKVKFVPRT